MNPIGIRSCYGEGKRAAETLFFDYHRQHGLDIKIARIFNTYGPGMLLSDWRVLSNFFVKALTGQPITILGEGDQTRSFCLVDDLVAGFVALMETDGRTTGPINLENPGEISIRQLAELVINATGSNSKLMRNHYPATIQRNVGQTSQRRKKCSAGSQRFDCAKGLSEALPISKKYCVKLGR